MEFIKGMDVSMVKELESYGAVYYLEWKKERFVSDIKRMRNQYGTRIRIWQDPYDEAGNVAMVVE